VHINNAVYLSPYSLLFRIQEWHFYGPAVGLNVQWDEIKWNQFHTVIILVEIEKNVKWHVKNSEISYLTMMSRGNRLIYRFLYMIELDANNFTKYDHYGI